MSYKHSSDPKSSSSKRSFFDDFFIADPAPKKEDKHSVKEIYSEAKDEANVLIRRFKDKIRTSDKFDPGKFDTAAVSVRSCIESAEKDDQDRVSKGRDPRIPDFVQNLCDDEYESFEDLYADVFGRKFEWKTEPTTGKKSAPDKKSDSSAPKAAKPESKPDSAPKSDTDDCVAEPEKTEPASKTPVKKSTKAPAVRNCEVILLDGEKVQTNLWVVSEEDPNIFSCFLTADNEPIDSLEDFAIGSIMGRTPRIAIIRRNFRFVPLVGKIEQYKEVEMNA